MFLFFQALEVYLHNPWLTYTLGLHRLRESGLAPDMMDDLDERPLTLDEIHRLTKMLFLGDDDGDFHLPHPSRDWDKFLSRLQKLIDAEPGQWNPVKKRKTQWISMRKLESAYGGGVEYSYREPSEHRSSSSSRSREPSGSYGKRHTYTKTQNPATTAVGKDLLSVVQRWGFEPPNYTRMYSLQRLLATVPRTFPANNRDVEPHPYFSKWKAINREAFEDEDEEELRELLKRGEHFLRLPTSLCCFPHR